MASIYNNTKNTAIPAGTQLNQRAGLISSIAVDKSRLVNNWGALRAIVFSDFLWKQILLHKFIKFNPKSLIQILNYLGIKMSKSYQQDVDPLHSRASGARKYSRNAWEQTNHGYIKQQTKSHQNKDINFC